jgi:hypothetical protein
VASVEERLDELEDKVANPPRNWAALLTASAALIAAVLPLETLGQAAKERWWDDPPEQRVVVQAPEREPGWTYGQYVRARQSVPRLDKRYLSWPGYEVTFGVEQFGYTGKRLEATGWVLDAETGARVQDIYDAVEPDVLIPSASHSTENASIWLAEPKRKGKYKITVAIYTEDGHRLSKKTGKAFAVR